MAENEDEKSLFRLVHANPSKGSVVHVYERKKIEGEPRGGRKIAEILVGKSTQLKENITPSQEADVMFIANNLKTAASSSGARKRILFYLAAEDQKRLVDAYQKAKTMDIDFNPAERMYEAMLREIEIVEKNQTMLHKRVNDRVIFEVLQKQGDSGFEVFKKIAKSRYGKIHLKTNLHSIELYKKGAGTPAAWEFAVALETLVSCQRNVFRIGLHFKEILRIWFDANKAACSLDQMIEEFSDIFSPESPDEVSLLLTEWHNEYSSQQLKFGQKDDLGA